jgi:hypothetical protein
MVSEIIEPGWSATNITTPIARLWADGYGAVIAAGEGASLSEDEGKTWTQIRPRTSSYRAVCVAADKAIYLGNSNGAVYISRDKGRQWISTKTRGGRPIKDIAANSRVVLALTTSGVFRGALGADTWTQSPLSVPDFDAMGLVVDASGRFYVCGSVWKPDTMQYSYQGTHQGTRSVVLLHSDDDGASWIRLKIPECKEPTAIAISGDSLYIATCGQLLRSAGSVWKTIRFSRCESLRVYGSLLLASYQQVLRSDNNGESVVWWRGPGEGPSYFPRDVLASATGHIYCASRNGVHVLYDASLRGRLPTAVASLQGDVLQPKQDHETRKIHNEWEMWLDRLLAVWRETRSVRVAKLIREVSAKVSPTHATGLTSLAKTELHMRWIEVSKKATAVDIGPLLQTMFIGSSADILQRVKALDSLPDDPRVATALASWVDTFAFGATSSRSLWVAVFRALERLAEEDSAASLRESAGRTIPISGAAMKDWMERALPAAAQATAEAAIQRGQPLTHEMLALCAEVEASLYPNTE